MQHEIEQKFKQASSFENENKYLHAIQIYEKLIAKYPDERYSYVKLSKIYERLNNLDAAQNILNKSINLFKDDEALKIYFASFLIKNNFYSRASDVLDEVSKDENPEVFFLLGVINFNLKENEISHIYFDQYIEINKGVNNEEALIYLTKLAVRLNKIEDGFTYIQKAADITGLNFEAHLLTAQLYYFKEMNYHAYESIKKALKLNYKAAAVNEWAGRILYALDDYVKAEKHLRNCINSEEVSSEIYTLLGLACKKNNKMDDANLFFEEALLLNPNDNIAVNERINNL